MEKPLTIKINEFRNKLCKTINEAELPAYILINELSNFIQEVKRQDDIQVTQYNESLKGSEEECEK